MQPRSRVLRVTGISLLLPLCVVTEADAQHIPLIFSERPKSTVSAVYQLVEQYAGSIDLMGIRLRRNLTDRLGVEAVAARFVGSKRDGFAHYGVSLYHTLVPTTEERRFAAGYEIGLTKAQISNPDRSLHGQLWGVMRVFGGLDRSLSLGARQGLFKNWPNAPKPGLTEIAADYSGWGLAFGVMAIFDSYHLRVEWEDTTNAIIDNQSVFNSEVGLRW